MSAWSCPHDIDGVCQRVAGAACDPGMRGCVLHGKVVFAKDEMNVARKPVAADKTKEKPAKTQAPKRRLPF